LSTYRFDLSEKDIPTHWVNLAPSFKEPMAPPLHPGTRQPVGLDDMTAIFPEALVRQEMSTEARVEVPQPVRDVYSLWRPTPLLRAVRLEKALGVSSHIYYKYEGASPVGSHKPNTAVPQAYYNKLAGTKRLATETGAGQWGSSLSFACSQFGLQCKVYMVKVSYGQKPYRRLMMQAYGGAVVASPSQDTDFGRKILAADPDNLGSLGIAISEAIEDTVTHPGTKYSLGSVLNHVCLHQSVVGQEALKQMALAGEYPDIVLAGAGGGSNFAGLAFPFMEAALKGGPKPRIVAVEPESCPSLTQGEFRYDFGDTAGMTPLMKMHTLGHEFMPPSLHAGGLRYHGMAPLVSHALVQGLMEATSVGQREVFEAALLFTRSEGLIPAPESAHAIAAVLREAKQAQREGKKRVILFNLSGHGLLDLASYDAYLSGQIQ
jgi:tryptophan synthase beta chain